MGTRVAIGVVVVLLALCARGNAAPLGQRDEDTATLLSVGGTVGPLLTMGVSIAVAVEEGEADTASVSLFALGALGLYALPSAGHWYSGKGWTRGFGIRTVGIVIAGIGALKEYERIGCHCFCSNDNSNFYLMGIGGAFILSGAAYDIATASDRARAYNARLQPVVTPVPMPGGGGVSVSLVF